MDSYFVEQTQNRVCRLIGIIQASASELSSTRLMTEAHRVSQLRSRAAFVA